MNTLEHICADKREHIARAKRRSPLSLLEQHIATQSKPRGFLKALQVKAAKKETGLIAEIKKASPSKGIIREDFDPPALAEAYAEGGAACLSVLTDEPYFQGMDAYLIAARAAVTLPVLRKDFMLDPYQIAESRALGADCILLIVAALEIPQALELEAAAFQYGMDALVEVHDETELETALAHLKSPLIGINNRSLKTLAVDLATTKRLAPRIPPSYTSVCESGIFAHADILDMQAIGVHCFLVGESLMREQDVVAATRQLLGRA